MNTLTAFEYSLVRASYQQILSRLDNEVALTRRIYQQLLLLAPEVRDVHGEQLSAHEEELFALFSGIIVALDKPQLFTAQVAELDATLAHYRSTPVHYSVLKAAVMNAFYDIVPGAIDPLTAQVWSKALDHIICALQPSPYQNIMDTLNQLPTLVTARAMHYATIS